MNALLHLVQTWFVPAFHAFGGEVSRLEAVAFVLAIVMVLLNMRVNALAWPLAIVSSLLYFLLFWNSRLYSDASLQLFFVVVAGWGWWQWRRGTKAGGVALVVRPLSARGRWIAVAAWLVAWPVSGAFLARYTDTDVPFWDAFPTAGSLVGQWLLGRKYIENWTAWLVVNVASVGLFAFKGLWLTVVLYAIFVAMSIAGWRAWQRLTAVRA